MRTNDPDEDAYGRGTNPERYQPVVDAAYALVAGLVRNHEVTEMVGHSDLDFRDWHGEPAPTIRLVPADGARLTLLITGFPGVQIRFGEWGRAAFPECGCDACDEQPSDVIERMHHLVEAAVAGEYREELTTRVLTWSFAGAWGEESGHMRLERGEWRELGRPGTREWSAWPAR